VFTSVAVSARRYELIPPTYAAGKILSVVVTGAETVPPASKNKLAI
jgi:hypothetical protein